MVLETLMNIQLTRLHMKVNRMNYLLHRAHTFVQ
jgi:hypothetical protein